jgi:AcrR family transcriptional regulator
LASDLHFSTFSTLTPVQAQVVAALAQGSTVTAAAQAAGLHRTTVYQWLKSQPEFATALKEARREFAAQLRDSLDELSALALSTLRSLLEDPATPASVRLRTALAILERPRFPDPGWVLHAPVETPERQRFLDDFALVKADYKMLCAEEALKNAERREEGSPENAGQPPVSVDAAETVARNAPCPCGSGRKFKRCCGANAPPLLAARGASATTAAHGAPG